MPQTCGKTDNSRLLTYYISDTTILGDCQVLLPDRDIWVPICRNFLVGPSEVSVIRVQIERAILIDILVEFL